MKTFPFIRMVYTELTRSWKLSGKMQLFEKNCANERNPQWPTYFSLWRSCLVPLTQMMQLICLSFHHHALLQNACVCFAFESQVVLGISYSVSLSNNFCSVLPSSSYISLNHHWCHGFIWHLCNCESIKKLNPEHTRLHNPCFGFVVVWIFQPFYLAWTVK